MGAAGLVASAWPFVAQLKPDAATRAAEDVIDVDLAGLQPAQPRSVLWRNLPIVVVQRTSAAPAALRDEKLLPRLVDAKSEKHQQPAYAANWHRSIDPAVAVLVDG